MDALLEAKRLGRRDYLMLSGFCLVLFGFSMISGRPLSMHEAVLPQSAREMLADGDWIVPKRGGAPWLESPPLPQWITVSVASLIGRCDQVWIVRLPATLAATATVLMVAWMATHWFGRTIGLLSGFVMATTCEMTRYSWLAEDEIFLCSIVTATLALFTYVEFNPDTDAISRRGFAGTRTLWMLAFFIVLGMTNLAKGLLFGSAMAVVPIAGFLIWNADLQRIGRYFWLWGWLAFAGIAVAWPVAAYLRYFDVLQVWGFDLGGRLSGNYIAESNWYYPVTLLWILVPWTLVIPFGFWVTRHEAIAERYSPQRFLWCWALLIPIVFSIPNGKHHHYLLHAIAPWAILASFGLVWVRERIITWPRWMQSPFTSLITVAAPCILALLLLRERIPGPSWIPLTAMIVVPVLSVALSWALLQRTPRLAAQTLFAFLAVIYCFGHWYAGVYVDKHRDDVAFIQGVHKLTAGHKQRVLVDMQTGGLQGFLYLFYLDERAIPIHNLSFLRDEQFEVNEAYVITRLRNRLTLEAAGQLEVLLRSKKTANEGSIEDRLTLFKLNFRDDMQRLSSKQTRISPMQAMYRKDGPFLGEKL